MRGKRYKQTRLVKTMRTKKEISYSAHPAGFVTTIPAGTRIVRARNLTPKAEKEYWVQPWRGMSDYARSWSRNYGFLVSESEIR